MKKDTPDALMTLSNSISKIHSPGPEDKLIGDLFVSYLINQKQLSPGFLRKLMAWNLIERIQDLYFSPPKTYPKDLSHCLSLEQWRQFQKTLLHPTIKNLAETKARWCLENNIKTVTQTDVEYPSLLQPLEGMPLILFYKGDLSLVCNPKRKSVALVGTRLPTPYGVHLTKDLATFLSSHPINIVSGLARGIDSIAHQSTLDNNGKTVAVLPCGLDQIYPPENKNLRNKISDTGLLLSEMPPGQKAIRQYFPARNRIISGLSDIIVIIEASEFSGTLHTANYAAAQGKDIFVVPGSFYSPQSKGSHKLILDGAEILIDFQDILAKLAGLLYQMEVEHIQLQTHYQDIQLGSASSPLSHQASLDLILEFLKSKPLTFDELVEWTHFSTPKTAELISELEISQQISMQNNCYTLTFFH